VSRFAKLVGEGFSCVAASVRLREWALIGFASRVTVKGRGGDEYRYSAALPELPSREELSRLRQEILFNKRPQKSGVDEDFGLCREPLTKSELAPWLRTFR
jgi:hypothetical protein